jgi:hypothetical protein
MDRPQHLFNALSCTLSVVNNPGGGAIICAADRVE